ncbi:hypothetical protein DM81_3437 [Burkholderia multivorans]|uniref:hypothetical protein n=1 Tax=Burkholderia multivorans TaxID=87883 RepID=UPI000510484C|nr:hypothetical protein [Burkholderia multivorans]KGC03133.1 hypothetical protein DM81_3437 [Burkholderia multivorans]
MNDQQQSRADALTDRAKRLIQRVASAQLAVAELPPGMPRTAVSDTIDEARAFARAILAASPVARPAAALTSDQRQALGEAISEYFEKLDSDEGIRTSEGRILRAFDYCDSRNVDDLIDRAILPALATSANETGAEARLPSKVMAVEWLEKRGMLSMMDGRVLAEFCDFVRETDAYRSPAMAAAAPADERAECIAWAIANGFTKYHESMCAAWEERARRAAASPAASIPAGWKLVPIEPTESMVVEGFESWPDQFFSDPEVWAAYEKMTGCQKAAHKARLCYAAMLAAAPQPAQADAPAEAREPAKVDTKARMDWADSIVRKLPPLDPTYSIVGILEDHDPEDRDEVLHSIRTFADMRATQALFALYSATADAGEARLTDDDLRAIEGLLVGSGHVGLMRKVRALLNGADHA